jgi:hypothetical protein
MPYVDPLLSLSDALYRVLALDSTLGGLLPGGVWFDVPPNPSFPFAWLELRNDQAFGGFHSRPGRGGRPGLQLRVHVFQSDGGTVRDAQLAMARIVELLWSDTPLTADGYTVISGTPLPEPELFRFNDEELRGLKVHELVLLTDYVLEAVA